MSELNEEFTEGLMSELNLWDFPSVQTSVTGVVFFFGKIQPLSQVSGESPFEFKISGQNSAILLDLRNSQIYVRLKSYKGGWYSFDDD